MFGSCFSGGSGTVLVVTISSRMSGSRLSRLDCRSGEQPVSTGQRDLAYMLVSQLPE